ncbi:hypothetical protein GGR53DRAFT_480829 [Hypoxylon sp. FL1150]|nr:hypothetical protein GGR53DRAFT_480829 [Hypoxylon sp. FL1150]
MAKSHQPNRDDPPRKTKRWAKLCLALLTVAAFIATAVLGVFVMVGCVSTSSAIGNLFLAELRFNSTYDIHLRFGYFGKSPIPDTAIGTFPSNVASTGGCVIIPNLPASNDSAPGGPQSHCIMNMRASDVPDLTQEFWEKLNLDPNSDAKKNLEAALNKMLPAAKNLQATVFNWEPPLVALLLFLVSSIMLLVGVTAVSPKRRYKATQLTAVLLGAFAIASALVTDVGSRQAANALLGGDPTLDSRVLGDGVFVQNEAGADLQYIVQDAAAACFALFYVILGVVFVRRNPEDRTPFGFLHHITINTFNQ